MEVVCLVLIDFNKTTQVRDINMSGGGQHWDNSKSLFQCMCNEI